MLFFDMSVAERIQDITLTITNNIQNGKEILDNYDGILESNNITVFGSKSNYNLKDSIIFNELVIMELIHKMLVYYKKE